MPDVRARASFESSLRRSVAELAPGEHVCWIYDSDEEHRSGLTAYLGAGLAAHDRVLCAAGDEERAQIEGYMRDAGLDPERHVASGQLVFVPAREVFADPTGRGDAGTIAFWGREAERAVAAGWRALRATGNARWFGSSPWEALAWVMYETRLRSFVAGRPLLMLCQLDRRVLPPEMLLEVLSTQPLVVAQGELFHGAAPADLAQARAIGGSQAAVGALLQRMQAARRSEQALRESEARYRAIVEGTSDGVALLRDGAIQFVNHAFVELCGYREEELLGRRPDELLADAAIEGAWERYTRTLHGGEPFAFGDRLIRRKDGRIVIIDGRATRIDVGGVPTVMYLVRDVTAAREAETAARELQDDLHALAAELPRVEERERRRIAADLHDGLGQVLAVAKIRLEGLNRRPPDPEHARTLAEVHRALTDAVAYTRSLTADLSPPVLGTLGLEAGLEWLADRMRERYGLPVEFRSPPAPPRIGGETADVLFAAARELLHNVVKHAAASRARLTLERNDDDLRIVVEDDGRGFDADARQRTRPGRTHGFGLFSIRERLAAAGAALELRSQPGRGTTATVRLPLGGQTPAAVDPGEGAT